MLKMTRSRYLISDLISYVISYYDMNLKHGICTVQTHSLAHGIYSEMPVEVFLISEKTAYLLHDKNSS